MRWRITAILRATATLARFMPRLLATARPHRLSAEKQAYRRSERENEALAMTNLGFKLLQSGFLAEAQQQVDRAASVTTHGNNVPELLRRLNEAPKEESGKLDATLEKTKAKAVFYRRLGGGISVPSPNAIASTWKSQSGVLDAKLDGTSVTIVGSEVRPTVRNRLVSKLELGHPLDVQRIEYSGQVHGNVILGQVKRRRDGETPSLSESPDDNAKVLMVFNEERTEIFVMERPDSLEPRFYTLTTNP
jgi:hypothetical protein